MEYFTVLWITVLSGPLDGSTSGLIYENLSECNAAVNVVTDTLPYDYQVACKETYLASGSIRPMPRPYTLIED